MSRKQATHGDTESRFVPGMKITIEAEPRDLVLLHAWAERALELPEVTDHQRAVVRDTLRRLNVLVNTASRGGGTSLTHPDAKVGGTCPHGERNGGLFCAQCIEDDRETLEAAKVWDGRRG